MRLVINKHVQYMYMTSMYNVQILYGECCLLTCIGSSTVASRRVAHPLTLLRGGRVALNHCLAYPLLHTAMTPAYEKSSWTKFSKSM